jgi:nucleotide-binding universal stress UspA family protein
MFNKVLVPLDGTELAAKILPYIENLAKNYNTKVVLMTTSHFPGAVGLITKDTLKQIQSDEKAASEKYLDQIARDLQNSGLDVDWVYKEGLASTQIVATAKEQNADLIAMAAHSDGDVAWDLGSVSEKVVKNTTIPVLLLPVKEMDLPHVKPEWFLGA